MINQASAVIAAVCLSFISVSAFLVLPVFIGAVASDMGVSEQQLGFMASGIMTGSALSSILAVFWIRRVDWLQAAWISVGLLLVAHLGSLLVEDFLSLLALQCIAGLGGGAAYSLALTALSDNEHPDRCFGYSIAAQVSFQVIGMLLLPTIIERYGLNGVLTVFASLAFTGLMLLRFFPRAGLEIAPTPIGDALFRPRVLAALAGCFFFFFNVGALWTYVERMAVAAEFEPGYIGSALAVGVALGIPGALLAAWCGDRFSRVGPLAVGALGTVIALFLLQSGMSKLDYMLAVALYNFCWNFSLAFQYAAVNAADDTGRSVAAAPAFHGAGAAAGPGVAALFVTSSNFGAVNILAGAAVLLSFLMFVLSAKHGHKRDFSPGNAQ